MSADSASRISASTVQTDAATPPHTARRSRRRITRLSWAAAIALVVLAAPAAAFGIAGGFGATHGTKVANTPQSDIRYQVGRHSALRIKSAANALPATSQDYHAYVALAGGDSVAEVDVATDTILADSISADSGEGVAVTPDGSQIFVAETGQYDVIAVNATSGTETPIEVGAYPQDVAVSPDGSTAYATVTSGDTGPGGSNVVAVISTATDKVTADITAGPAPRQIVFSPDGSRAYVTTEDGVDVIDTATQAVIKRIPDRSGPQGIAISPDGSTLYVTNPALNSVWVIRAATGRVTNRIAVGAEPYAVAVTPNGTQAYVADMNADSVAVIDTVTGKVAATVPVGHLPASVAVTPDGTQVWVGNTLDGDITVINPATDTVAGTISGGTGTATLDAAPLGIAFVKAP